MRLGYHQIIAHPLALEPRDGSDNEAELCKRRFTDLQWRSIPSITMSQLVARSKEDKRWLRHSL